MENTILDTAIKRETFWRAIANGEKSAAAYKKAMANANYWHRFVVKNARKEAPLERTAKAR